MSEPKTVRVTEEDRERSIELADNARAFEFLGRPPNDPIANLAWSQRRDAFVKALAAARAEGAEEMRENAAATIDRFAVAMSPDLDEATGEREAFMSVFGEVARCIRSLPSEPAAERKAT